MQTKSRDGKFILSAPDFANTGAGLISKTKFDEEIDVYLEVVEGQEVSLYDVAYVISHDCFSWDCLGLRLLTKTLKCQLTVKNNNYKFIVEENTNFDAYLEDIAKQFKL